MTQSITIQLSDIASDRRKERNKLTSEMSCYELHSLAGLLRSAYDERDRAMTRDWVKSFGLTPLLYYHNREEVAAKFGLASFMGGDGKNGEVSVYHQAFGLRAYDENTKTFYCWRSKVRMNDDWWLSNRLELEQKLTDAGYSIVVMTPEEWEARHFKPQKKVSPIPFILGAIAAGAALVAATSSTSSPVRVEENETMEETEEPLENEQCNKGVG